MPIDPITGGLGPYSNEYLTAATNVANGNTAPYAPGVLNSYSLPEYTAPQRDTTYDQWGGKAQYDAAVGQVDSGLNNIRSSGTNSFGSAFNDIRGSLQNNAWGFQDAQTKINNGRANNELGRLNGIQDILGYVRSGLKQGGARLAAANATDSSATGALQKAYQQVGAGKTRSLNNQAGLKANELDQSQAELGTNIERSKQTLATTKNNKANEIGNSVQQSLQQLDQQAIGMSLPGRIAIDQEKQNIVNAGIAQLNQLDQFYNEQLSAIHSFNPQETATEAQRLQGLGTAASNPFTQTFDSQNFVDGAPIDQLPLFTRNKRITG